VSKEKRLNALLIAGIALPPLWYFAVIPAVAIMLTLSMGFGLACGINCDEMGAWVDRFMRYFIVGSIAAYVLIMGLGVRWVVKGQPAE
jgi:hypothetical protein